MMGGGRGFCLWEGEWLAEIACVADVLFCCPSSKFRFVAILPHRSKTKKKLERTAREKTDSSQFVSLLFSKSASHTSQCRMLLPLHPEVAPATGSSNTHSSDDTSRYTLSVPHVNSKQSMRAFSIQQLRGIELKTNGRALLLR